MLRAGCPAPSNFEGVALLRLRDRLRRGKRDDSVGAGAAKGAAKVGGRWHLFMSRLPDKRHRDAHDAKTATHKETVDRKTDFKFEIGDLK